MINFGSSLVILLLAISLRTESRAKNDRLPTLVDAIKRGTSGSANHKPSTLSFEIALVVATSSSMTLRRMVNEEENKKISTFNYKNSKESLDSVQRICCIPLRCYE